MLLEDRFTVDDGDVLECCSDHVGELTDELVVRHASAVSTELPVQLDPCSADGVDVDQVDGGGCGGVGVGDDHAVVGLLGDHDR